MKKKILDSDTIAARADTLRAEGRELVLTNGCFDLLHVGHEGRRHAERAQAHSEERQDAARPAGHLTADGDGHATFDA